MHYFFIKQILPIVCLLYFKIHVDNIFDATELAYSRKTEIMRLDVIKL